MQTVEIVGVVCGPFQSQGWWASLRAILKVGVIEKATAGEGTDYFGGGQKQSSHNKVVRDGKTLN